jgi:hypothetical protein
MNSTSFHCLMPRCGKWNTSAGLVACIFSLACFAAAQNSQYVFDPTGNLLAQASETIALPQILGQPQLQVVMPGELASFSVVVADTRGVSFQWQFNGANMPAATNDALLLANVSTNFEGVYSVVVANASGSVTSAPAALMIDSRGVGMPDSWQLTYFGNLNQSPGGDFDGDGVSNLREFLDGTNPTNRASLLFQLTLFSDGGHVTVNPSRFSFTNGETVTLTATAFPPNIFHGWIGDIVTASNSVTLTMTNNKTVYALLGSFYNIAWTNLVGGDWRVASNWMPNIVPGSNDNVFITNIVAVTLNNPADCANLTFGRSTTAPTLSGNGTLTLHGTVSWVQGTFSGSGKTVIDTGATLNLANSSQVNLTSRTLENGGTILWTAGGNIALNTAVLTNGLGALFATQGAGSLVFLAGFSRFDNAGTFRKSVNTGMTSVANFISFNNYGTVDIRSGVLAANGGYSSSSNAVLNCAIGGMVAGADFGQLKVAGVVTLNGWLSVNLVNNYVPAVNDSFTILIAGARDSAFENFLYPSNEVSMQLSNTATSVNLRVANVFVVPQPLMLPPQLSGSNISLTWTTVSNTTYRLEFSPDLTPSNWNAVTGDVTALSNTAGKLDLLTPSNRYYRVRVVP